MLGFEAPHQEGALPSPLKCILLPPCPLSAAFLCPLPWEVEGLESVSQDVEMELGGVPRFLLPPQCLLNWEGNPDHKPDGRKIWILSLAQLMIMTNDRRLIIII